jgi:4-hydroxybenzoate polyprenyltransferase
METVKAKLREIRPALALFYLSFMGCFCVLSVQVYLGIGIDPAICLVSMALIFGIYTYNRFTDLEEDFTNDIARVLFFQKKRIFFVMAVTALAGSFVFLLAIGKLTGLHFLLLGVGVCYSYRMIPWWTPAAGLRLLRIKEMTFVKNLAVSFLWSACVFAIPMLYSAAPAANRELLPFLGLGLFLSTLNNTLFDDILDEAGDRIACIKTLPTVWGARKSYLLLWSLDAAWLAAMAVCWSLGMLDAAHAVFLSLLAIYPFAYMWLHASGRAPKGVVDILAESDLMVFAVGLMLLA